METRQIVEHEVDIKKYIFTFISGGDYKVTHNNIKNKLRKHFEKALNRGRGFLWLLTTVLKLAWLCLMRDMQMRLSK